MVAETKLYWIVYSYCCKSQVDLVEVKAVLEEWRSEWQELFGKPLCTFTTSIVLFKSWSLSLA